MFSQKIFGPVLGAALVLAASVDAAPSAPADTINEWSSLASQLAGTAGMSPLRAPITLAMVHLAMYDGVNAIAGGFAPYASKPPVKTPASMDAAAVEAAYGVLVVELPSQLAALDAARAQSLDPIPEPERTNGVAVGAAAAEALLARRVGDGRDDRVPYTPGSGPGTWIPTPPGFLPALAPFLAKVVPFTMDTPWHFRPDGPPALVSGRYAHDYAEVKRLGERDSLARTPEQTATALFWEPFAGTVWPVSIRRVATERGLDITLAARYEAAAFTAFADALVGCWDAKYHFNFWRPVTAIQQADTDGNPRTDPKFDWEPLAITPPFPEYASGHATVTAAVTTVMEDFFPRDLQIPAQNVNTGEERFYSRAAKVIEEVVEARMLLGVHFRTADEDGAALGRQIARRIGARYFQPDPEGE
jgi:hypothetical protein